MVLNIFVVLFIAGITFMHSIFGAFSGLINVVCCIAAMAAAFGFTEALNEFVTGQGLHPSYTLPVCFVVLFFLTHVLLRVAADNLIRGNVRIPMYVDWGGAAVCGFLIAMITTGVMVLGFLMLPWGGRVAMFSRDERLEELDADGRVQFARHSVWLKPDEFTVGLFNLLSGGSLKGRTTFASVYPDFSRWVFWTGNTVQCESATAPYRNEQGDGFGGKGISVVTWWEQKGPVETRYRAKLPTRKDPALTDFKDVSFRPADSTKRLIGMRLQLTKASADRTKESAYHRFRPTMIRVVGDVNGEPREYTPRILGGVDPATEELRLADLDNNFAVLVTTEETLIDAYFEVNELFEPHFVEYRRFARTSVPPLPKDAAAAPTDRLMAQASGTGSGPEAQGVMRFIDAIIPEGTGDKTELPFPLAQTALAQAGEADVSDGRLRSGRIAGARDTLAARGGVGAIRDIALPERKRLFQLRCKARTAASLAGQVFNFVGSVVNSYKAYDDAGGEYRLSGYYAIVKRGEQEYFELYVPNEEEAIAFRGSLDFKNIRNTELRDSESIIGLLFFVNPGVRINAVKNQTGQGVTFDFYQMGG